MRGRLAVALVLGAGGCGGRTVLDIPNATEGNGGLDSAVGGTDAGSEEEAGILCSLYKGPVASCDAGVGAGAKQRCGSVTPICSDALSPGFWGCCSTAPDGQIDACMDTLPPNNQVLPPGYLCL